MTKLTPTFLLIMLIFSINTQASSNTTAASLNDTDLVEITNRNFEELSDNNDIFLIYEAEDCEGCKELKPIFLEVAREAKKKHNFILGVLDVTLYKKLFIRLEARNQGVIRLIKKGKSPGINYWGGSSLTIMTMWFNKFIKKALSQRLNTVQEVEEFAKDKMTIIHIGKREISSFDVFEDLASKSYDLNFGDCETEECKKTYKAEPGSLIFLKNSKFSDILVPGFTLDTGVTFLLINTLEKIEQSNYSSIYKLYQLKLPALLLYAKTDEDSYKYKEILSSIFADRKKNLAQIQPMIVTLKTETSDLQRNLQIKEQHLPTALIVEFGTEPLIKYKLDDRVLVDKDTVSSFLNGWDKKKLERYYFSDDITRDDVEEEGIVKVSLKNIDNIVFNNKKDVMLFIHSPFCGYCIQFSKIYPALRRQLSESNNLILASLDASKNEVIKKFTTDGFPTILFWAGNNKKKYIEYTGERQIYLIKKFIVEHGAWVTRNDEL